MLFNEDYLVNVVKDAPNGSEMKIFLYIAFNQPKDGIFGYQTTKEQLANDLNLKIRTIYDSLKWLKDNLMIQELKMVDHSDFMCNPYWVMNNGDKQARINEFTRRCRADSLKKIEKRRRELKKSANQ